MYGIRMLTKTFRGLRRYRPVDMRRRNLKKVWMLLIVMIFATYFLDTWYCFTPPIPDTNRPGHPHKPHSNPHQHPGQQHPGQQHPGQQHPDSQHQMKLKDAEIDYQQMEPIIASDKHQVQPQQHHPQQQQNRQQQIIQDSKATTKSQPPRTSPVTKQLESWIVVLSSTGCDVTHFNKIPEWKVVVVGKTPKGCKPSSTSRCTYLNSGKVKSLGYAISKLLPGSSDSMKMIGYLYAISKGANVIYDTECHIVPKFNRVDFAMSGNTTSLAFADGPIFNPYGHFGYPMLFPRGFPESALYVKGPHRYRLVDIEVPLIQQGQVNFILGKQDVSYLKLTKDHNITFDRSSPPVCLSGNRFGPIGSMNTVFLYKSFLTMFLPTKCKGSCSTVRGYFAQRLLAEIGGSTGFLSSTAYSLTPPTGNNKFVVSKQSTDKITENLISSLKNWKCIPSFSAFACAKSLVDHLAKHSFLSKKDKALFDAWVTDLKKFNLKEPTRRTIADVDSNPTQWNPQLTYASSRVIPAKILLGTDSTQKHISKHVFKKLYDTCPKLKYTLSDWLNAPITDIMLVVIFNYEFLHKNLAYLEFSHRRYFRHILYCGPSYPGFDKILKETNMEHITYVEGVDKDSWFFLYKCLVHAANMRLNVKGYLYVGDDLLLNHWNVIDLPRDTFWMPMPVSYVERNRTSKYWWYYWNKPIGRKAVNLFMDDVQDSVKRNPNDAILNNYLKEYGKNVHLNRAVHRSIDVFYAPARYNAELIRLGKMFRKHNTLLALAIPMLHAGLVNFKDAVHLKGKSLWRENRSNNLEAFNVDSHYIHPFKAGKDLDSKKGKDFFCDYYFPLSETKLLEARNRLHKNR
ncbi:probable glycosyltransferase STELLO1 [Haliotis rufescens]|uniref:probable glycosyltransferase STELLO1 n=1 Tax=Haliotis rufescens TaxID=6454 RepID=UPI00201F1608|nr:probable glycosyltransferase STELLO1 [Haliotis rufescens]